MKIVIKNVPFPTPSVAVGEILTTLLAPGNVQRTNQVNNGVLVNDLVRSAAQKAVVTRRDQRVRCTDVCETGVFTVTSFYRKQLIEFVIA